MKTTSLFFFLLMAFQVVLAGTVDDECHSLLESPDMPLALKSKVQPFESEKVISQLVDGARVVYIGEGHSEITAKEFLKDSLETFKTVGVTHLALEIFNSNRQPELDAYAEGKIPRESIVDILNLEWGWAPLSEYYVDVIDVANELEIKIVAIDGRHLFGGYRREAWKEAEAHMAERIEDILKEPDAKVLAFVGMLHAFRGKVSQRAFLEEQGHSTKAYFVYSKNLKMSVSLNKRNKFLIEDLILDLKIDTFNNYLPISETFPNSNLDGILFLESLSKRWRE